MVCRPAVGQSVKLSASHCLLFLWCSALLFLCFLYGYTSLFLCRFGPQVTTLLSSPHSLFPHFTSDFAAFFLISENLLSLVSLRPARRFGSPASVSFSFSFLRIFIPLSSFSAFISALIVVPCTALDNEDILGGFVLEAGLVLQ